MPPRPTIPADDLYARLGVPIDASFEAIDVAWRGLLRVHHPDIAGPQALETAKRLNVAHDWLSDPDLRTRYDAERSIGRTGGRGTASAASGPGTGATPRWATPYRRADRPATPRRAGRVGARAGPPPDDRRAGPTGPRRALADRVPGHAPAIRRARTPRTCSTTRNARRMTGLPGWARRRPAIRDAVAGRLAEIVLGDALDELLGESGGDRARERLTRGWDAAVGQPRYGPATVAVIELLGRLAALSPSEVVALNATGARERLGEPPWPPAASPEEDEALRVSSELAGADAARAVPSADGARPAPPGARRAASRIAHLLVLRHVFPTAAFDRIAAPWLGDLVPRAAPWRSVHPASALTRPAVRCSTTCNRPMSPASCSRSSPSAPAGSRSVAAATFAAPAR